ncbi:MAG: hypothetical protein H3C35_02415 [Bacteroidetes bacterium]|nr:hypothetical protein [Bacteroidota bacterium]
MTPLVTDDGDGGAIIFFTNLAKTQAYIQRINKNGYLKWNGGSPIRVGGYLIHQYPYAICSDGSGGAYLQYEETDKNIPSDTGKVLLFTNRIDKNGILLWNNTFGLDLNHKLLEENTSAKYYDKMFSTIVSAETQGYFYVWIDSANGSGLSSATLKLQRITPNGVKAFGEQGFSVTKDLPF